MEKYAKQTKTSKNTKILVDKSTFDNQVAKVAKKMIKGQAEIKSFDTGFGSSVDNLGTITKISTVPQGDTDSTRDGDQLEVRELSLLGSCVNSSTDATNVYRIILFRWNQDDTTFTISVGDLLQTVTVYSPYNRDNLRAKKFTVIRDWLETTSVNGPASKIITLSRKQTFRIFYQATGSTGTNNVYILMLSDSSAVPHPTISWVSRVWYTDL